jgi:hypothetical protein
MPTFDRQALWREGYSHIALGRWWHDPEESYASGAQLSGCGHRRRHHAHAAEQSQLRKSLIGLPRIFARIARIPCQFMSIPTSSLPKCFFVGSCARPGCNLFGGDARPHLLSRMDFLLSNLVLE